MNAAELAGKKLENMRIVVSGAGASAVACCNIYMRAGIKRENIAMFDSKGHINKSRKDLNKYKADFATEKTYSSLEEGMTGADVFIGLSKGGVVNKEMIKSMADKPIVFAMANPDPEINYDEAVEARKDVIMATGRSDFPNQVNNVLGFPFIFRGALDVRATAINEEMKMAAVLALANLAKENVPEVVINAYGGQEFSFGPEYIIPKPFDPRVLWTVAPAVAKAAIDSGVARVKIEDWNKYKEELKERLGFSKEIVRLMVHKAQKNPKKVVFPEGEEEKIIRAANSILEESIGKPVLVGREDLIKSKIQELEFELKNFEIHDPRTCNKCDDYAVEFYKKRQRKGTTLTSARKLMKQPNYYSAMMVQVGDADAMVGGLTSHYPDTIRPALQCVGNKKGLGVAAGLYIVMIKSKVFFFADTTVNIDPTADQLAEIAIMSADTVREFEIEPRVAMLSFSNFGSAKHPFSEKVKNAVSIVKQRRPDIIVDGEMQADTAVVPSIIEEDFPFSSLKGGANILIFPDLASGNIAYKLMARLTDTTVIGPILMGLNKPIHVLQRGATVDDIINMAAIAVVEAKDNHK